MCKLVGRDGDEGVVHLQLQSTSCWFKQGADASSPTITYSRRHRGMDSLLSSVRGAGGRSIVISGDNQRQGPSHSGIGRALFLLDKKAAALRSDIRQSLLNRWCLNCRSVAISSAVGEAAAAAEGSLDILCSGKRVAFCVQLSGNTTALALEHKQQRLP